MPNIITHKANRAKNIFNVSGNAGNVSSNIVLYQDFFWGGENKTLSYLNGTTEPTIGDNVIVGGEVIGKLESYSLIGGTWGGGNAQGALILSNMTVTAAFPDLWTTSSGGAGQSGATEIEVRETSVNDSSISDFIISAISDEGDRIQFATKVGTPNNAINWTESNFSELYEALVIIVNKSSAAWDFTLGDKTGTDGYVKFESGLNGMTVVGADNTVNVFGTSALPSDGATHTFVGILKPSISPVYSFEVDGVEVASVSGTNAGFIDMSVENTISFINTAPLGILVCRFKRGIPSDYREAIVEMRDAWLNGETGISSRFIGV